MQDPERVSEILASLQDVYHLVVRSGGLRYATTTGYLSQPFRLKDTILGGFISHVGLYLIVGRRREIRPMMYALALVGRTSIAGACEVFLSKDCEIH